MLRFGPILFVLAPLVLVALVGLARWQVGAHSAAQAIVITVDTFWNIGVHLAYPRRAIV